MTDLIEDKTQDAAASVDTTYSISINGSFEGTLADRSDEDWVKVELEAGESYDIRLHGIGPEAVPDSVLTLYDAEGEEVASNDDIEYEAYNLFSMLEFSPEHSGVYYLSAAGYQSQRWDNSGTYEITVFDERDDNLETPLTLSVGGRFHGTLDTKFDEDWIRVDLVAGQTYHVTLDGVGPDTDTDTVLRIYNQEGEQVGFHDDVDYAAGKVNSRLSFTPEATGTYYLSAGAYRGNPTQDNSGRYLLAVYDVDAGPLSLVGTEGHDYYHTRLIGSHGDDTLDGGPGWDWLEGGPGADTLIGSGHWDIAAYQYSGAGVEVRLDDGTARGGDAEGDVFATRKDYRYVPAGAGQSDRAVPDVEKSITARVLGGADDGAAAQEIEILDISDLFGSAHDDVLVGNQDVNWLWGYYGADTLDGREGDDLLDGGAGADVLIGGDDNDTVSYYSSNEGVDVSLHDGVGRGGYAEGDTFPGRQVIEYTDSAGETREIEVSDIENLYGSELHDDILVGSRGSNRLTGFGGDDELDGLGGHDLLEGRAGADVLRGGDGNDLASYAYSDEAVEVHLHSGIARGGGAEGDTFPGRKTVEYVTADGDTMEIEVSDIEDLVGSAYDDILAGAHGPNRLGGYLGDDELDGREGDDWLDGGPGADRLIGGEGNDTASYMFTAVFSPEGVVVRLHDGTARGGEAEGDVFAGTDVVEYTDAEGNTLTAEVPDIENLHGSTLADILAGDLRDNLINGDDGDDALYGGPGGGDDLLMGGPGDDRLYGGIGNDTLEGGPGDDQLRGGPDDDMLDGGEGDDVFFIAAAGNDTVLDFGNGEDRIDLAAFREIQSVEDLDMQQQETGVVIDLSAWGGGTVILADFDMADVTDSHFVFFVDEGPAMA
ncbi:MAG: pre-peptidase C-terminal domain-containing protein [Gammaproteobacteria bacterium]|nr:pre-peptidase C-terminal domain-containing protein [Gammaproteobacteria bacterium]